jgi:hypothetical protein
VRLRFLGGMAAAPLPKSSAKRPQRAVSVTTEDKLMDQIVKTNQIRAFNDTFRRSFIGGRIVLTDGILALDGLTRENVITQVRSFETFNEDNDPHGEHDFGSFKIDGYTINWKIDYYDRELHMGSPDPADPKVTTRVLTIMLAEEW